MTEQMSHAVVGRRFEPKDSADDFPTPLWATRALCRILRGRGLPLNKMWVWEPACGRGHMVRALAEEFAGVVGTDAYAYDGLHGYLGPKVDFVAGEGFVPTTMPAGPFDAIVTNPPFRLALPFARRATVESKVVALLCRSVWAEGVERFDRLFAARRPAIVAQFVERVPMVKGRCQRKAVTATSYSWFIWIGESKATALEWIPPCRKKLERVGDYDDDKV